jgi:hypothetical protein
MTIKPTNVTGFSGISQGAVYPAFAAGQRYNVGDIVGTDPGGYWVCKVSHVAGYDHAGSATPAGLVAGASNDVWGWSRGPSVSGGF